MLTDIRIFQHISQSLGDFIDLIQALIEDSGGWYEDEVCEDIQVIIKSLARARRCIDDLVDFRLIPEAVCGEIYNDVWECRS